MSDLHETIQEILHGFAANVKGSISVGRDIQFDLYERLIIEAFTDAGYLPTIQLNREQAYDMTKDVIYKTPTLMDGQEWLARFTNEMGEAATNCYGCSCVAMTAAKKVAGLTE